MQAHSRPTSIVIEAVVTRADGTVEHLGAVSYWHRSWRMRLRWRLARLLRTLRKQG